MISDSSAKSKPEPSSPGRPNRTTPKHHFEGHEDNICSFVFLHDNVHIVSGSLDGSMRKWDYETALLVGEPWGSGRTSVCALALSPDGETIACGRGDGSVQRWDTHGQMTEDIWTGHKGPVEGLLWSPSGGAQLSSGSGDGTILIRNSGSGEVEVGPIETNQRWVCSLAYSHLGDRIASGGKNGTICIWDTRTGELLVGPIQNLRLWVTSIVWSSDSRKLYSASDEFACVFDSFSGEELHRFQHDALLYSIALSPKHNLLACVGGLGIAQLWDIESYQSLGHPFDKEDDKDIRCVSFSQDGKYLAYSGEDKRITLWMVKDIAPEIPSPPPSRFEVDVITPVTRTDPEGDEIVEDERNIYGDNFWSSNSGPPRPFGYSRPSKRPRGLFAKRMWNVLTHSRHRNPPNESIRPRPVTIHAARPKKWYWARRTPRRIVREDQNADEDNGDSSTQGQPFSLPQTQSPPGMQPQSAPQMPQRFQSQPATRAPYNDHDYSCWANFWLAICCITHRPRSTVAAVQHATASIS